MPIQRLRSKINKSYSILKAGGSSVIETAKLAIIFAFLSAVPSL